MEIHAAGLNKQPLSQQIADRMEQEIVAHGSTGDRLPTEQQLSASYGVSRTIVREALKLLHARGLVDSKAGSGARITKPEASAVSDVMDRIIQMDSIDNEAVFEVRRILEEAAVSRAARHVTEAQLQDMEKVLTKLRDMDLTPEQRLDLDFTFHLQIASASGNLLLATLVEAMSHVIKRSMTSGVFIEGGIDDAIFRHQKILDTLRQGKPQLAKAAMREHLQQSLENVLTHQTETHAALPQEDKGTQ